MVHTHLRVNTMIYTLYILYYIQTVQPARTPWKRFALKGTLTHWVRTYWNSPTWVQQKWSPKHTKTSSSLVQSKFTSRFHSKLMVNSCQFHFILSSFCTMSSFQPRKKTSPPARKVRAAGPGAALWTENQLSKVVWKVQRSAKLPPGFQPRRLLKLQRWK